MNIQTKQHKHNLGKVSFYLSFLCLIHCILTPILVSLIPFLHSLGNIGPNSEIIILLIALLIGVGSILHGLKDHYTNKLPLILFIIGNVGLIINALVGNHHHSALHLHDMFPIVLGTLLMSTGQFLNLKWSKKAKNAYV